MFAFLRGQGLNEPQAAALLGNMRQESSLNPMAFNAREGAFGMMQWRGDRLDALKSFSASRGLDYRTREAQLAFAPYEARTSEAWSSGRFLGATDLGEANAGLKRFIRYGDQSEMTRLGYGRDYLNQYAGAEPLTTAARDAAPAVQQMAEAAKGAASPLSEVAKAAGAAAGNTGGVAPISATPGAGAGAGVGGLGSLAGGFGDMLSGLMKSISEVIKGVLSGIGSFLKAIIGAFFHGGGEVGAGGTHRLMPASLWVGAGKLHAGGLAASLAAGIAGASAMPALASDEVPAILLKKEVVLTEQHQDAIRTALGHAGISQVPGLRADIASRLVPRRYHSGGVAGSSVIALDAGTDGARSVAAPTGSAIRWRSPIAETPAPGRAAGAKARSTGQHRLSGRARGRRPDPRAHGRQRQSGARRGRAAGRGADGVQVRTSAREDPAMSTPTWPNTLPALMDQTTLTIGASDAGSRRSVQRMARRSAGHDPAIARTPTPASSECRTRSGRRFRPSGRPR